MATVCPDPETAGFPTHPDRSPSLQLFCSIGSVRDCLTVEELGGTVHFVKENMVLAPDSRSSDKLMHNIKLASTIECRFIVI